MANLQDLYYKKAQQQRKAIRELLQNGTSALLEMPNHETLFDINIKWLNEYGIDVEVVKDRDGRPICLIDTSRLAEIPKQYEDRYVKAPLFEEENQR